MKYEVKKIIFQNPENHWTVAKCATIPENKKEKPQKITLVGNMPGIEDGCIVEAEGKWANHEKYGEQIQVERYSLGLPTSERGIYNYLCSNFIKGIGKVKAKCIVDYFKTETLNIIENDYLRLLEVKGIGKESASKIYKSYMLSKKQRDLIMFLESHDISTNYVNRIYEKYGDEAQKKILENPYRLIDDIWGIGFKKADKMALAIGIDKESDMRIDSGILYSFKNLENEGHCFGLRSQLLKAANEVLLVNTELIGKRIDALIKEGKLEQENEAIYLPKVLNYEKYVANKLTQIQRFKKNDYFDETCLNRYAKNIELDEEQIKAIKIANEEKVMILTGGPGTGKTTVTNIIIKSLLEKDEVVFLAAPTGRAAKRMSEVCHKNARTIHRLLGAGKGKNPSGFLYTEENPLRCSVLIVDEFSMVDIKLMYFLLQAVSLGTKLIMVGDADQLPSVGAGNVLRDMIKSETIPTVKLDKIFRQAEDSKIITIAHDINKGKKFDLNQSNDFKFLPCDDPEENLNYIVKLYKEIIPNKFGFKKEDIQILAPMRNGAVGVNNLNERIQEEINKNEICWQGKFRKFKLGDRVMQIRNNYKKDVFNGDVGKIVEYDSDDKYLVVDYDGYLVYYAFEELDEIVLAYACTIHKSQGSEYPVVIMPITSGQFYMLQRNLIYTGVTRAKQLLIIVGQAKYLRIGCQNIKQAKRNTRLKERLIEFASY